MYNEKKSISMSNDSYHVKQVRKCQRKGVQQCPKRYKACRDIITSIGFTSSKRYDLPPSHCIEK